MTQSYLSEEIEDQSFYSPTDRGYEKIVKQRLDGWRSIKSSRGQ